MLKKNKSVILDCNLISLNDLFIINILMFNIFNLPNIKNAKNIAFAGVCQHMGTTTQAIQLCLYLALKGKKVCYVEMNDTKFLTKIQNLYKDIQYNDREAQIIYRNLILYKEEFYYQVKKYNFDFIIKDYGVYNKSGFYKLSFLEQDIKIIVSGIKANEIFEMEKILKDRKYSFYYIFNFVPREDIDELMGLMNDEKDRVFFSPIIVDMFNLYIKNDNFKFILGI